MRWFSGSVKSTHLINTTHAEPSQRHTAEMGTQESIIRSTFDSDNEPNLLGYRVVLTAAAVAPLRTLLTGVQFLHSLWYESFFRYFSLRCMEREI